MVEGTEGYEYFIDRFIEVSKDLDFFDVCKDFIAFLPPRSANVLDIGSGIGQNAAALAKNGFNVVAVEPMTEFLDTAKSIYKELPIKWIQDSFPDLACFDENGERFDFVLIDGVWHHINQDERVIAIARLSELVKRGGCCAISLRNGPPGLGTKVFPTDHQMTIEQFEKHGFRCIFDIQNQPSILPHKKSVEWSRVVFQKT